jgi:hypothetical protein
MVVDFALEASACVCPVLNGALRQERRRVVSNKDRLHVGTSKQGVDHEHVLTSGLLKIFTKALPISLMASPKPALGGGSGLIACR